MSVQDLCILCLQSTSHTLRVRSQMGCDTCLGKINDMPLELLLTAEPCLMASSQRAELKSQSQPRCGCLIALLEELQIKSWKSLPVP